MEIICSIGPNVKSIEDINGLVDAGMTMPRFNFSHMDYEKFNNLVPCIKEKYPDMMILQDLQGNKLRISNMYIGESKIFPKQIVIFCLEVDYKELIQNNNKYKERIIPITYNGKMEDFKDVNYLYMKDATMCFKILQKGTKYLKVETIYGGIFRAEKGVNAPGLIRDNLILTEKDKIDIEIGIKNDIDIICLSYVTDAKDMIELKEFVKGIIKKNKVNKMPKLWAKIECKEGINNFEQILKYSDGIMLGRGDLKSEVPIEEIPVIEENIINKMKKSKKKLIIATYILESMTKQDTARISEVNDIYKFVKNKVDGLMLSTEVAISREPLKVISFLKELYIRYENNNNLNNGINIEI